MNYTWTIFSLVDGMNKDGGKKDLYIWIIMYQKITLSCGIGRGWYVFETDIW